MVVVVTAQAQTQRRDKHRLHLYANETWKFDPGFWVRLVLILFYRIKSVSRVSPAVVGTKLSLQVWYTEEDKCCDSWTKNLEMELYPLVA